MMALLKVCMIDENDEEAYVVDAEKAGGAMLFTTQTDKKGLTSHLTNSRKTLTENHKIEVHKFNVK